VPSGIPEGLRIVEKSNWSGIGFVVPRSQLSEFLARPEAQRPGVYVLLGPDPEGSGEMAYIGEADPLGRRLEQHAASRDFWTTAFAFTDKDGHLNKAHGLHLEAKLIELAREARRSKLDNLQQGRSISLSEVDRAEADGYLSELLLCCPVLGLRVFERPLATPQSASTAPTPDPASAPVLFQLRGPEAEGQGYESPGGFTVLEGARARLAFVDSSPESVVALRHQLTQQGVFVADGQGLILSQSYEFNSPSQAAVMLLARSANGLTEWKASGLSLREHRQRFAQTSTDTAVDDTSPINWLATG
jgi:catechol 2,3-dioxygenase-like lactoylglutathione lyase family enzyme